MEYTTLRTFVVHEGNEVAYNLVRNAANNPDGVPLNIVVHGEHGAGKSHLLKAASLDCKLLWVSKIVYANASELELAVALMDMGRSDQFLDSIGSCGLLLLDDADGLLADEMTRELLKLLLIQRASIGAGTVLSCADGLDLEALDAEGAFAGSFSVVDLEPLPNTAEARAEQCRRILGLYPAGQAPQLDEATVAWLAGEKAKDVAEVATLMRFVVEKAGLAAGEPVTQSEVMALFE